MHAVGTTALGRYIMSSDGLTIVGAVNRVKPSWDDDSPDATALLWAGAAKLLDACRAVDADVERDGVVSAGAIEAVRSAIKDAVITGQGSVTLPVTMAAVME